VLLYAVRVATSQNAQQLVVRDEEKARERVALGVQIVVERLLTALETLRECLQVGQPVRLVTGDLDIRLLRRLRHYLRINRRINRRNNRFNGHEPSF